MAVIGTVLVLAGALLLAAEARAPAGLLGAAGGVALTAGSLALATAAGAGMWAILPITLTPGLAACLWVAATARRRPAVGQRPAREALDGEFGIVRQWTGGGGQVVAAGALWRARRTRADERRGDGTLHAGDAVIVERVSGATLSVRRAADSEGPW
jgi:membrane protein implicated in regulation of membrane protease activity